VDKSPEVVRIYLPPDANCLLSTMDHCFRSTNYVNVVVADKQNHLQFLPMEDAVAHCTKGIGIWDWASNDSGAEPDVVVASCGDVMTQEALAATALLRTHFPDLKVRFVNVVDLFKLIPNGYHPHGLTDKEYNSLFTNNKPIVFAFHSYPWLVHRLTYNRPGQHLLHVRGYKEKGNINTPLELAIRNEADRFSLAILAIDNMGERLGNCGAGAREKLVEQRIMAKNHAYETGLDVEEFTDWTWPF
jgi:xylulose-5-phosphate/fructose-6-phosphate phosphoketolase